MSWSVHQEYRYADRVADRFVARFPQPQWADIKFRSRADLLSSQDAQAKFKRWFKVYHRIHPFILPENVAKASPHLKKGARLLDEMFFDGKLLGHWPTKLTFHRICPPAAQIGDDVSLLGKAEWSIGEAKAAIHIGLREQQSGLELPPIVVLDTLLHEMCHTWLDYHSCVCSSTCRAAKCHAHAWVQVASAVEREATRVLGLPVDLRVEHGAKGENLWWLQQLPGAWGEDL